MAHFGMRCMRQIYSAVIFLSFLLRGSQEEIQEETRKNERKYGRNWEENGEENWEELEEQMSPDPLQDEMIVSATVF